MTRVGLLFSGQGSQKSGMGAPWQATDAWAVVDTIAEVSGHDLADLLLHADDETLKRTDRAQIATFALEMVVLAHYRARAASDAAVVGYAGHSLGEYSALVATEILELRDAARLVEARGAAMLAAAEARPGTMIAVIGASADAIAGALAPLQANGRAGVDRELRRAGPDRRRGRRDRYRAGDGGVQCAREGGRARGRRRVPFTTHGLGRGLRSILRSNSPRSRAGSRPSSPTSTRTAHPGGPEWIDLLARRSSPRRSVGPSRSVPCWMLPGATLLSRSDRARRCRTSSSASPRHADGTGHAGLMVRELGPHREYVL